MLLLDPQIRKFEVHKKGLLNFQLEAFLSGNVMITDYF